MGRRRQRYIGAAIGAAAFAFPLDATAQTLGNEVWIGQTGGTNTITIVQEGRDNRAGEDNVFLRLDQDGDENSLVIEQQGGSNRAGVGDYLDVRPSGITQVGRGNSVSVDQSNDAFATDAAPFNIIGAVYQQSLRTFSGEAANIAEIEQFSGTAGRHAVGSVVQYNLTGDDAAANVLKIVQSEGGATGNFVDEVYQEGSANSAATLQSNEANTIGQIRQFGIGNRLDAEQHGGRANAIAFVQQTGSENTSHIRLSGSGNTVERVLQNNDASNGLRNLVNVLIKGRDNGGEFRSAVALALDGVARANLTQIGGNNDINVEIDGTENRYGVTQDGDDNEADLSISAVQGAQATGNEQVIFQSGRANLAVQQVVGSENVAAIRQDGDDNAVRVTQRGNRNLVDVDIFGSGNNALLGNLVIAVDGEGLNSGTLVQTGNMHGLSATVQGSSNAFAVRQDGEAHRIMIEMTGPSNTTGIVQTGIANTSMTSQSGMENSLSVRQY